MEPEINVLFDLITALAYLSIPITLLIFLKKRKLKEFSWVFTLFILFIFLCGTAHFMHFVQHYNPSGYIQDLFSVVKILTAMISVVTAIMLWWILPKALLIPSPSELEKTNQILNRRTEEVNEINKLLRKEIEEHKKTTEKLQYLTAIMKSSNDAIIGVTMEGKISSWNLGAAEIFGYTHAEMIGKEYSQLIPAEQMDKMKEMFLHTVEGQRLVNCEIDLVAKNESVINGPLTVSPVKFDNDGAEIVGISVIVRDLTDRKKLENEMNRLTQIKTVSEIAASISHEVRNPLTVTRGFTQLLKDGSLTTEQREQYIKLSLAELDRAERIIGDYLTFAKPSIENVELLNLNKEIDYIIQVINPYATLNNITVDVIVENAPFTIFGEKQKLHQSLLNIIKNGIEAMEDGGKIEIQLKKMDNKALLIIKDDGKGMTKEQIKKLGTPYYSTKVKGTGLGTMVAFSIIKAMQGEFKIESSLGNGSSFFITFPIVELQNLDMNIGKQYSK